MNGIEKIIARIGDDASAEAKRATDAANAEILAINASADEKIKAVNAEAERRASDAEKQALLRAEKAAETKKRDIILKAKNDLIDRAFDEALMSFSTMDEKTYVSIFSPMLASALSDASLLGEKTLVFSEKERFEKTLLKSADVPSDVKTEKTGCFVGGFVLKTDGIEISCTAEKLIASEKSELCADIYSVLFG